MTTVLTTRSGRARHHVRVAGAFVWIGYTEAIAFPLGFALTVIAPVVQPIVYRFVSDLVESGASVAYDYFTFAVIGIVTLQLMRGGLNSFGVQLDTTMATGRFESLHIEPISWRIIPFGLAAWPIMQQVAAATVVAVVALLLGAHIQAAAVPAAVFVLALSLAASHAVGVLSGAVKVLSKRNDPIVVLYTLVVSILSGVFFPVELMPAPLRALSYTLPPTYALTSVRRLLMPDGDTLSGPSTLTSIVVLVVFVVVMYTVALAVYGRAVQYARKLGVLGAY